MAIYDEPILSLAFLVETNLNGVELSEALLQEARVRGIRWKRTVLEKTNFNGTLDYRPWILSQLDQNGIYQTKNNS